MISPHFNETDHHTWKLLFGKQTPLRREQLIPEFSDGLELLGINENRIPDLAQINEALGKITGWKAVYVKGYVEARPFFEMLKRKEFPIGAFIRDAKDLSYTPEPDVFHDLYGHLPFFTIPEYAKYHQEFGDVASRYATNERIVTEFQRLFWFTSEFALVETHAGKKIFGAGIASSFRECAYALSQEPHVVPFDLNKIRNKDFRIDVIQEDLFILNSPDQLYNCLSEFETQINS